MQTLVRLADIGSLSRRDVGGKALALSRWKAGGAQVPEGVVVTTGAYGQFLTETPVGDRLTMELGRKEFARMRWEELWDAALRIRHLFLKTPLPDKLERELALSMPPTVLASPVAVRSSAPEEDSGRGSFAGLHESYVQVRGWAAILRCLKLVWASLWSDRALLYRQELGLGVETSRMAVLIQTMVAGECSGIVFSRSPDRRNEALVESVWGLNQGLVDGTIEPDRWRLERETGAVIDHVAPRRLHEMVPAEEGAECRDLPSARVFRPPLGDDDLQRVWRLALAAEEVFGAPQDVEWTLAGKTLWALQARPVTAMAGDTDDERGWYLSLRRSVDQLEDLRARLEDRLLPAMAGRTEYWEALLDTSLSEGELALALNALCREIARWRGVYRRLCIPMAHGMRLFGQFFNDTVQTDDPFAFVPLLVGEALLSTGRNRTLAGLAERLAGDRATLALLEQGRELPADHPLVEALDDFDVHWGKPLWPADTPPQRRAALIRLLLQMVGQPLRKNRQDKVDEAEFMERVPAARRAFAKRLLGVARASYRLRDNDNIYIGRLEACFETACAEGLRRLEAGTSAALESALRKAETLREKKTGDKIRRDTGPWREVAARQSVGQPAGPGLAKGRARVVKDPRELAAFQKGEVLVCDAVDPVMTVVAPLAAAVVERRGGMLIHGAIIAREYGLPCVTGVPDATEIIRNGDLLTVDGYLGIVIRHGTEVLDSVPPAG